MPQRSRYENGMVALADDLTGACDAGIQFHKLGYPTQVFFRMEEALHYVGDDQLLFLDTETRNLPPVESYRRIREVGSLLRRCGGRLIFKKIDSTFRGNIGPEIDALLDEGLISGILVAPSYPTYGRVVVEGVLKIDGLPVSETPFARDPASPITESHIPTYLRKHSHGEVAHIPLQEVRRGGGSLTEILRSHQERGVQIFVADAVDGDDLRSLAEAALKAGILPSGSAGLASATAEILSAGKPVLIVSGSVNPRSMKQLAYVAASTNTPQVHFNFSQLPTKWWSHPETFTEPVQRIRRLLDRGRSVVVRTALEEAEVEETVRQAKAAGLEKGELGARIIELLSAIVANTLEGRSVGGLVLTGGDTALGVLEALGAVGISLGGEVLPGIPLGRIKGGMWDGLRVITKAGGFGDENAISVCLHRLREGGGW